MEMKRLEIVQVQAKDSGDSVETVCSVLSEPSI